MQRRILDTRALCRCTAVMYSVSFTCSGRAAFFLGVEREAVRVGEVVLLQGVGLLLGTAEVSAGAVSGDVVWSGVESRTVVVRGLLSTTKEC